MSGTQGPDRLERGLFALCTLALPGRYGSSGTAAFPLPAVDPEGRIAHIKRGGNESLIEEFGWIIQDLKRR
jgi:hypothetical protein